MFEIVEDKIKALKTYTNEEDITSSSAAHLQIEGFPKRVMYSYMVYL